jgi:hypothetical protein
VQNDIDYTSYLECFQLTVKRKRKDANYEELLTKAHADSVPAGCPRNPELSYVIHVQHWPEV